MLGGTERRKEVEARLQDVFVASTGLPIIIYEKNEATGQPEASAAQSRCDRPFCEAIQRAAGRDRCENDSCSRAAVSFAAVANCPPADGLVLCHAGLWNERVPVRVNGEVRAVVCYGELRVDDSAMEERGVERVETAIRQLALPADQAADLRRLYEEVPRYARADIDRHKGLLRACLEWFYPLVEEADRVDLTAQRITHEIQTRMQQAIARAENLANEIAGPPPHKGTQEAFDVLYSIEALNTVVQTLGDALGEYHFESTQILPLVIKACHIYQEEAHAKDVDVAYQGSPALSAEVSEPHLQHALNNLVHNAVKYSFRSVPDLRRRFVLVDVHAELDELVISVENYGVGMLPDEIASRSLFQLNARGRLTRGEFRPGSGKGLYFVDSVIRNHHGRIEVTSDPADEDAAPEGLPHHNRFTVHLPLRQGVGV